MFCSWRRVLLVTNGFHQLRSRLVFLQALKELRLEGEVRRWKRNKARSLGTQP